MRSLILASTALAALFATDLQAQLVFNAGSAFPTGLTPEGIAAADLDGDGDPDLVVANSDSNFLSTYWTVNGVLTVGANIALPGDAEGVVAFDADGDGDIDLATANSNVDSMSFLINNGGGSFSLSQTLPTGSKPIHLVAADFDGDQDRDLAVVNRDSNSISLFTYAAGSFSAAGSFAVGADPRWIAAADLDGDLDNDLAVVNHDSDSVTLHTNNGAGSFSTTTTLSLLSPNAVEAGDLDGDGDMDLAVTQGNNTPALHGVVVYRNTGGAFTNTGLNPTGLDPHGIELFDADGDGDLDVATADRDSNRASVLENTGAGALAAAISFNTGLGPQDVAAADFDGDGDLDLAVTNEDSNQLTTGVNNGVQNFTTYGMGCGSGGFMPTLSGAGEAVPGGAITLTLTGPPSAFALLLVGNSETNAPFATGCSVLVSDLVSTFGLSIGAGGSLAQAGTIPPASPIGPVFMQFVVADSNAPNGKFGASNGLRMNVH